MTYDLEQMARMRKYEYIMGDVYSWINPYLLLTCSQPVRKHFKEFFFRQKNGYLDMQRIENSSINTNFENFTSTAV